MTDVQDRLGGVGVDVSVARDDRGLRVTLRGRAGGGLLDVVADGISALDGRAPVRLDVRELQAGPDEVARLVEALRQCRPGGCHVIAEPGRPCS